MGDARAFSAQLSSWLKEHRGTRFLFNTIIQKIVASHGKITAVDTTSEIIHADAVVVCLGAWSADLLKPLGVKINIYPVRGYSVTLPPGATPVSFQWQEVL